jgi:flagellar biosynthetic protein FlhB
MAYLPVDLQFFSQEKTEQATPKKREESRKKGQVGKSADVTTALMLFMMFLFFWFIGSFFGEQLLKIFSHSFRENMLLEVTERSVYDMFISLLIQAAMILGPVLVVALTAALIANYVQVGFLFSTEAIAMKLERINPLQGFKKIYSLRAIVEMLKSILKISLVGFVTFLVLWLNRDQLLSLSQISVAAAVSIIAGFLVQMGLFASIALLFLSIFDYVYQRYDYEKNIRMSKNDVKDEFKKTEGDPEIKSKIKEKQRQMSMQRMMQEVPQADVIITNPTHFAVALKYEGDKMDAPVVIAKGADFLAVKMKEIAKKHDIVVIENRPLARTLYAQTDIGNPIPDEFFKAVAEILAYVYRLKKKV